MHPTDQTVKYGGTSASALSDHIAVTNHGKGVDSESLANFIECIADFAGGRVRTTGRLQYEVQDTGGQRFEELSGVQLVDELVEELADTIAYAAMIAVKVLALRNELQAKP